MVYEGNENYIFISYAHENKSKVLSIADKLSEQGFRVWYDSGIEAGTEWPAYIESKICNAKVFLVFMSPATVDSKNCRNEINYALELQKDMLVVHLQETELLWGLRLQLSSTQAMFRQNHSSEESFISELIKARILQCCRTKEIEIKQENQVIVQGSKIANIYSMGTSSINDFWPQGEYSKIINREEFDVVVFHTILTEQVGVSGTINCTTRIYNSQNQLVFEKIDDMEVQENHDRLATTWSLINDDGSIKPDGEYRFEASVNNSPVYKYYFVIETSKKKQTMISNVYTIGVNDTNELWPEENYSNTINRDETSVIVFHSILTEPLGISGAVNYRYKVYDSENQVFLEYDDDMNVQENHDRFATSWNLIKENGKVIPEGKYRFEVSINNSPIYTYFFTIVANKKQVPSTLISNICSIGTNDVDDIWPKGTYSDVINRDQFQVVYFHIMLVKNFGFSGSVINTYKIYNSRNQLIFDDVSELEVKANYDRISTGWILKGTDGSFVPSGDYRFEATINGSDVFTYNFTVTSNLDTKPKDKSVLDKLKTFFG